MVKLVAERTLRESATITAALLAITHALIRRSSTVPALLRIAHALGAIAGMLGLRHHHYR